MAKNFWANFLIAYRVLNLIIETELDGVKQYSAPKDEVLVNDDSLIVWNESLFFEMKNLVSTDCLILSATADWLDLNYL